MLTTRVIPCLLLKGRGLVKTVRFRAPTYVGDPINAVRIFNEKEVDELVFLDISATVENRGPAFDLVSQIASECFMPFCYGGGVQTVEDAQKLISLGAEKVCINTCGVLNQELITNCARLCGSQSIVASIDVRKDFFGRYRVFTRGGHRPSGTEPVFLARELEKAGAGEILLTSIDREGTMQGYDLELIRQVSQAVTVPVVANGGAGNTEDFVVAVAAGASAVAAGSLFVFEGKHRAVLINYPSHTELVEVFSASAQPLRPVE